MFTSPASVTVTREQVAMAYFLHLLIKMLFYTKHRRERDNCVAP